MRFFGFFFLIFGAVIIAYPEFLAYIIGFFFLILGANILLISPFFRKATSQGWKFGEYEILRNKK